MYVLIIIGNSLHVILMAEIKTKPTKESVTKFLKSVEPKQRQLDGLALLKIFTEATGEKAVMWGTSIVGFGKYHYKSEKSKQEADWPYVGFSPRKQNFALYVLAGSAEDPKELARLGKHKRGGSCLYINRLSDIDENVLAKLVKNMYMYQKKLHKE